MRVRYRDLAAGSQIVEENDKFISAKARDSVILANDGPQLFGKLHQYDIADIVTLGIIYILKVIQIQKYKRGEFARLRAILNCRIQFSHQHPAIEETCQRVKISLLLDDFPGSHLRRNILDKGSNAKGNTILGKGGVMPFTINGLALFIKTDAHASTAFFTTPYTAPGSLHLGKFIIGKQHFQ